MSAQRCRLAPKNLRRSFRSSLRPGTPPVTGACGRICLGCQVLWEGSSATRCEIAILHLPEPVRIHSSRDDQQAGCSDALGSGEGAAAPHIAIVVANMDHTATIWQFCGMVAHFQWEV